MRLNKKYKEYFNENEYMISDSALENCQHVVSAYKKPPAQAMPRDKEKFNTRLAKARITAEHTIGMLKGRFQWLKDVNMRVTRDRKSMLRILKYIDCCIILHNLMIEGDKSSAHTTWINADDFSDIDDEGRAPSAYDRLYRPLRPGCTKDERRQRLKAYFEFKEYA